MSLVDKVSRALELGEYAIAIFLDFSKAFDTVNHDILYDKLQSYGIRGIALDWIKDYLSNRQQYVNVNGSCSEKQYIKCGVPQGSVLGPLLFLLYINDIVNVSPLLCPILFADDTNALITGKNLDSMADALNVELSKITVWLNSNKLSLNVKKTHFMVFASKGKCCKLNNPIKIGTETIQQVGHTKFLGVIIDNKLNWSCHMAHIKNKMSKGIGIICKARKNLNEETLTTLYYSFIYPYINYCIIAWGNTFKSYLDGVYKIQKKAVRVITKSSYNAHSLPLFRKLHIMPLHDVYIYNVAIFMYKHYHNIMPPLFSDMFVENSSIHNYMTRQTNLYHQSVARLQVMNRSIRIQGVKVWNIVFKVVDVQCTFPIFKRRLKICIREQTF